MINIIKFTLLIELLSLIGSCSPWVYITVKPDNFVSVNSQYKTFLFGSYNIDTDREIYLDLKETPDLLVNRIYYHELMPGKTEYFLIPIPDGEYHIRTIYFRDESYYQVEEPFFYQGFYFRHRWFRFHYYYYPENYYYYYYPTKVYPYPFDLKLEKGKIYYFGRIVLTNNHFSVENKFDEDKALLLTNYQSISNAYDSLSNTVFVNILK